MYGYILCSAWRLVSTRRSSELMMAGGSPRLSLRPGHTCCSPPADRSDRGRCGSPAEPKAGSYLLLAARRSLGQGHLLSRAALQGMVSPRQSAAVKYCTRLRTTRYTRVIQKRGHTESGNLVCWQSSTKSGIQSVHNQHKGTAKRMKLSMALSHMPIAHSRLK